MTAPDPRADRWSLEDVQLWRAWAVVSGHADGCQCHGCGRARRWLRRHDRRRRASTHW